MFIQFCLCLYIEMTSLIRAIDHIALIINVSIKKKQLLLDIGFG